MVQGRVLVIAGSDSSGGAGLEADQKVIAAHGCYAMTATTALTAQDTTGVHDVHHVPQEFLVKLIDACVLDIGVDVVKTGMLASAATIQTVASSLQSHGLKKLVVDPVMVATSGAQLLPHDAVKELRAGLLPLTTVLTPNIPEATLFLQDAGVPAPEIRGVEDLEAIARAVQALGPEWVLVKGGHAPLKADLTVARAPEEKEVVVDVLYGHGRLYRIQGPYQDSKNTHGTGCSLASAIASNMAKGMDVPQATTAACRYIEGAIRSAPGFGKGHGPLDHFHSTYTLPFARGRFVEYLLDRPDVSAVWHRYIKHPFVMNLGKGTLPVESFKSYLVQDYLYLVHFARANALSSYKAKNIVDTLAGAAIVSHIGREMSLHIDYCKTFGISVAEIEASEEHQACTAYSRYILDVGQSDDWLALKFALAPCLLGYGIIARHLHGDLSSNKEGNIFWTWVENYVADDYAEAVKIGSDILERHAVLQSPARLEELAKIFIQATELEIGFWEMFPAS